MDPEVGGDACVAKEKTHEFSGQKHPLAVALPGLCLTALVVNACGARATAGKGENHEASTSSSLGHLPQWSERVKLGSADFAIRTENPCWPMAPGDR